MARSIRCRVASEHNLVLSPGKVYKPICALCFINAMTDICISQLLLLLLLLLSLLLLLFSYLFYFLSAAAIDTRMFHEVTQSDEV